MYAELYVASELYVMWYVSGYSNAISEDFSENASDGITLQSLILEYSKKKVYSEVNFERL